MGEFRPILGIDLGTTNSVLAVADGTSARVLSDSLGRRLIPSCVSFPEIGPPIVGHDARMRRLVDARNTVYSVKRLLGRPFASPEVQRALTRSPFVLEPGKTGGVQVRVRRGTYALPEISAMVLRHLRQIAEESLGETCQQAVVAVPANFNELQRSATRAACKVAGLEVLRVLNEPTAATLAYGYGREQPGTVAVYDLGGGTFDITLLDLDGDVLEVVSTAGDTFLGGDDIDLAISDRMAERCHREHGFDARNDPQAMERLRAAAEWAKCELSSAPEAEMSIEEFFEAPNGEPRSFRFRMGRAELEQLARPLVERSLDVVREALREAGRRPREVTDVVLVGGSTRMPLVRSMVERFFERAPRTDIDPDLVVAQGAAIHGWTLAGSQRPRSSSAVPRPKPRAPSRAPAPTPSAPIPRQPAFAPDQQRDSVPSAPPAFRTLTATPSASGVTEDSTVTILSPPVSVGVGNERGLLTLDDPLDTLVGRSAVSPRAAAPGAAGSEVVAVRAGPIIAVGAPSTPARPLGQQPVAALPEPFAPFASGPSGASSLPVGGPAWGSLSALSGPDDGLVPPPRTPPTRPMAAQLPAPPAAVDGPPQATARPATIDRGALPMRPGAAPLLMDVTPLSLGLEAAGRYRQVIIPRNAPLPAERMRVFTTGRDDQEAVEVRICQGEGALFDENTLLGTLVLDGLRKARRGTVHVEITFAFDASGLLDVRARDADTGLEQRTRIQVRGGLDDDEVTAMRARQEQEQAQGRDGARRATRP
jgi:molecular chaperone DnaK